MQEYNTTKKIKIQEKELVKINKEKYVKAKIQGKRYIEIMEVLKNTGGATKRINKKEYVVVRTGEIKQYKERETEDKSIESLKQTFNRLMRTIRTNFEGGSNELFITLTYKENMQDTNKLMKDFEKFYKRLKRKFKEYKFEYISVAEPQERGAWHIHMMLKTTNQVNLYIDNKLIEKLWGNGYTDTQRLKSNDVGSYYVSYFTDLLEENTKGEKKRKKGARLNLYPKNFKFYRVSRGIKKPDVKYLKYGWLEEQGYKKTYATAFQIVDTTDNKIINEIQKETWKK